MKSINALIIGAGGIGSWLTSIIDRLDTYDQVNNCVFTIADFDTVENKNLPYQNFDEDEIFDSKSLSLSSKFNVKGLSKKIDCFDDLDPYDLIVCAVDSASTRKLVFEYCEENKDTYFIDLRSEGQGVYCITSEADYTLKQLKDTLDGSENGSCQLAHELDDNIIQLGNRIIASIGAQLILNYIRDDINIGTFNHRF